MAQGTLTQDDQHLQLLSIFHYVVGGLLALFSLFPLIHLTVGLGMLTSSADDAEMRMVGGVFVVFAASFILAGLALAGCVVAAGVFLARRTHYTFCLVIAGVECIFMPFGTVLGVFTLVVLLRDPVKAQFAPAEV